MYIAWFAEGKIGTNGFSQPSRKVFFGPCDLDPKMKYSLILNWKSVV